MPLTVTDAPSREQWQTALETVHLPHIYDSWEYGEMYQTIRPTIRPLRLLALKDGKPVGVLQCFEWKPGSIHRGIVSGGSGSGGGPSIDASLDAKTNAAVYAALLERAEELFRERQSLRLLIYTHNEDTHPMPSFKSPVKQTQKYNPVIDLPSNPETMLEKFHRNARRHLQKSQQCNVQVSEGGREDLKTFWEIQQELASRKKLNKKLLNSCEDSEKVWDIMHALHRTRLYIARHEGRIVTISIVWNYGKSIFHRGDVCNQEGYDTCANHAVHWHILKTAIAEGFTFFNLMGGVSDPESARYGVTSFKLSLGARLAPFYRYSVSLHPFSRWMVKAKDILTHEPGWFPTLLYP